MRPAKLFTLLSTRCPRCREVADVMATKDEVFTLVLTAVSGGKEPFTYTVTGLPDGLPTGLSFDEPSLTISRHSDADSRCRLSHSQ